MSESSSRGWEPRDPSYGHATAEDYSAFLTNYYEKPTVAVHALRMRAVFVHAYPDLRNWFTAPLDERVGRLYADSLQAPRREHRPSYLGRPYLYYLTLTGSIRFDWDWLLLVQINIKGILAHYGLDLGLPAFIAKAVTLGYSHDRAKQSLTWVLSRLFLHAPYRHAHAGLAEGVQELLQAVRQLRHRPDLERFYGSSERYEAHRTMAQTHVHMTQVVLYHCGLTEMEPHRSMPTYAERPPLKPRMEKVVTRYLATRALTDRPATVEKFHHTLRHFATWLTQTHPLIESFADVTREHLLAFSEALTLMVMPRTGQPLAAWSKLRRMSCLSVFFRETAAWEWDEVPGRPLVGPGDLPKMPERVP